MAEKSEIIVVLHTGDVTKVRILELKVYKAVATTLKVPLGSTLAL